MISFCTGVDIMARYQLLNNNNNNNNNMNIGYDISYPVPGVELNFLFNPFVTSVSLYRQWKS